MSGTQRLDDGREVVSLVLSPVELMSVHAALAREASRLRRVNGAAPATLGRVVARVQRLAEGLADTDADMPSRRSTPRRGHADVPATGGPPSSASPGPRSASVVVTDRGPAQTLTTAEVARHLGMSARHVRRLVDNGDLDGLPVDGRGTLAIDPGSVAMWALQRPVKRRPDGLAGTP